MNRAVSKTMGAASRALGIGVRAAMRIGIGIGVGIGMAFVGPAASAHHSQSEFDFRLPVNVEGTVTELRWLSPHARLYVDVVNAEGKVENWNFELPSPTTLMRRGWTRKSLQPGDRVTVNGARAKNFPTIAYARSIKDAEGQAMFTGVTEIYEPPPPEERSE